MYSTTCHLLCTMYQCILTQLLPLSAVLFRYCSALNCAVLYCTVLCWSVVQGLITTERKQFDPDVATFMRPAEEGLKPGGVKEGTRLLDVVKTVKPHVLLGLSGVGRLFTPEVRAPPGVPWAFLCFRGAPTCPLLCGTPWACWGSAPPLHSRGQSSPWCTLGIPASLGTVVYLGHSRAPGVTTSLGAPWYTLRMLG